MARNFSPFRFKFRLDRPKHIGPVLSMGVRGGNESSTHSTDLWYLWSPTFALEWKRASDSHHSQTSPFGSLLVENCGRKKLMEA
jgi:hypothetical protein